MADSSHPSRRDFIKWSGIAGAASALTASCSSAGPVGASSKPAKNLIFLVVDGMCNGTLGHAHHWKLRNEGRPLHWMQMFEHEGMRRCFQDTASANSPVTDSAAAASAWGCGQRVNNGSICTTPDGKPLKPIMSYAKEAGKRTGLVTTCGVTHATPAGFAANVEQRNRQHEIARQYLEREIDVILGGGSKYFKKNGADLRNDFQTKGYQFVQDRAQLDAASGSGRLLGLFSEGHIPYCIDRKYDPELKNVPGLAAMFQSALKNLDGAKDGFVLQVEGGRVDHAGHANDPGSILHEMLEFDNCIPIALDYIKSNPDTLLIVTTDHGTGGCQLDGLGGYYLESGPALDRINQINHSFEWLQEQFSGPKGYQPELIEKAFGIVPTQEQSELVVSGIEKKGTYLSGTLTEAFGEQLTKMTAVGWSSRNHTSECVDLFAFGPGAEKFPAFFKNNDLFGLMTGALGVRLD